MVRRRTYFEPPTTGYNVPFPLQERDNASLLPYLASPLSPIHVCLSYPGFYMTLYIKRIPRLDVCILTFVMCHLFGFDYPCCEPTAMFCYAYMG